MTGDLAGSGEAVSELGGLGFFLEKTANVSSLG